MRFFDPRLLIKKMFLQSLIDSLSSRKMLEIIGKAYFNLYIHKDFYENKNMEVVFQKVGQYVLETLLDKEIQITELDVEKYIIFTRNLTKDEVGTVESYLHQDLINSAYKGTLIPNVNSSFAAASAKVGKEAGGLVTQGPPTRKDKLQIRDNFIEYLNIRYRGSYVENGQVDKYFHIYSILCLIGLASDLINSGNMLERVMNCIKNDAVDTNQVIFFYQEAATNFNLFIKQDRLDLDGEPTLRFSQYK